MRSDYHDNLRQLAQLQHQICLQDRTAIADATQALVTADIELAEAAIDSAARVDTMTQQAEQESIRLLTLQAPVASELRQVVTAIQLIGNLQRMGALAGHVAVSARRRHPDFVVADPVRPLITRMGAAAVAIATSAAEVLESGNPDSAAALDAQDDAMDRLHEELLGLVLNPDWGYGVTAAVDLTLLGRYYERFADNAVEVGRRTIFLATGETAETWTPPCPE
ncbi:phosphate signaling complex PhoU family protein [Nocardia macrotermitis]|uniref:Phosphate-specific transport system accessory protein PhoU n=1 Tax=Nocardia macrotermitis TaxID=2585198 RepID=A0A7K0D864_9NOCA|nr:PhoU domain-containing protein [Nocardia macrotermitis]MQY21769.1 Phosphate-specific transport system accessory protein PhoU [Nocardia macrotermitis]